MKFLFALVLLPLAASAAETQTLSCQGHELAIGNNGKNGTMEISATKLNDDKNDLRINLVVGWTDSDSKFTGPGKACGMEVPAGMSCTSMVSHPGSLSYQIHSYCGERRYRAGLYNYDFETSILLSSVRDHGRISCRGSDGLVKSIEISACESK